MNFYSWTPFTNQRPSNKYPNTRNNNNNKKNLLSCWPGNIQETSKTPQPIVDDSKHFRNMILRLQS